MATKPLIKKSIIYFLLFVVGFMLFFLTQPAYSQKLNEIMSSMGIAALTQRKAEDFTLKNLSAREVSLDDFKGKVVFLNFWATWCPPCRAEIPSMEKLYEQFKDKDFVILAVNLREDNETVAAFARKKGMTFPILLDSRGKIGDLYHVRAIPTTYLIDRNGKIVGRALGGRDWGGSQASKLIKNFLEK